MGKAEPAAASPPAPTKKRPASPASKPSSAHREKEPPQHAAEHHPAHPLHDDRLPADVVEEGRIFFFYRPRVAPASADTSHAVSDVSDIQRTYVLLQPLAASDKSVGEGREALAEAEEKSDPEHHGRPLCRVFVLPRKTLPGRSGEPRLAICAKVSESVAELTAGLAASTYETKTRGLRQQPAARVVARGAYVIVAPTAGPVARAAREAQQREEKEKEKEKQKGQEKEKGGGEEQEEEQEEVEEEEEDGDDKQQQQQQKMKKARRASAVPAPAKPAAAAPAAHHSRPVRSARLLWLIEAPRHDGPAQAMLGIEHRGALVIKVKGPRGSAGRGGGGGGGFAPPPPKLEDLPGPARARLEAARGTQWVELDTHAALDFKGAQLLMVAQYAAGGAGGGPGALEAGGLERDRAAMAEEAGPDVAAALADLAAEDSRALVADARAHGEPARGALGGALRRALMAELGGGGGGSGEGEEEKGEEEHGGDWAAAHDEEAEAQLRLHEKQQQEEEEQGEEKGAGAAGSGGGKAEKKKAKEGEEAGALVVEPAITGQIV